MMTGQKILLSLVALAGFQGADTCVPASKDLPERYRFLERVILSEAEIEAARSKLPYDRIELSESTAPWRTDGLRIDLGRDGSIVEGAGSPRTGTISIHDFGQLCWLLERIQFETMPNSACNGYDARWFSVKVWHVGSRDPVTVIDYGGVGSPDLWTLRTAIRGVESRASWK